MVGIFFSHIITRIIQSILFSPLSPLNAVEGLLPYVGLAPCLICLDVTLVIATQSV